jgi:hypothetical protein
LIIVSAGCRRAQPDFSMLKDRQIHKCFRASRQGAWRAAAIDEEERNAQKTGPRLIKREIEPATSRVANEIVRVKVLYV